MTKKKAPGTSRGSSARSNNPDAPGSAPHPGAKVTDRTATEDAAGAERPKYDPPQSSQSTANMVQSTTGAGGSMTMLEEGRPAGAKIKVRATRVGFYDNARRRIGDVFTLVPRRGMFSEQVVDKDGDPKLDAQDFPITKEVEKTLTAEQQFSPRWMERVDARLAERTSTPNQEIAKRHDEEMAARHSGAAKSTGDADPLND